MKISSQKLQTQRFLGCCLLFILSLVSTNLFADPPGRALRLSQISGNVSFLASGLDNWVDATLNRPLTIGDRLWIDSGGQANLQIPGATLCLGKETTFSILDLSDRVAQFQVTQGRLNLWVDKIDPNQDFEVDTPNLALTIKQPGFYRIDVDPDKNTTLVSVYEGQATAYGEQESYTIDSKQAFIFTGTDINNLQSTDQSNDALDSVCLDYQQKLKSAVTTRYVSSDVIGYEDLYQNGEWTEDENYGYVWYPDVSGDWAPYQNGSWVWIDPWGWTWIEDSPWGFAPFHYGRWAFADQHWFWVPDQIDATPVYAPALVAFLNFEGGDLGWFPLAPGEAYWPAYDVSQGYFLDVNSGLGLQPEQVVTIYNSGILAQNYSNFQNGWGLSEIPSQTFIQANPVRGTLRSVDRRTLNSRMLSRRAAATPTIQSAQGSQKTTRSVPPTTSLTRSTLSKHNPVKPVTTNPAINANAPAAITPNIKPIAISTPKQAGSNAAQKAAPTTLTAPTPPAAPTPTAPAAPTPTTRGTRATTPAETPTETTKPKEEKPSLLEKIFPKKQTPIQPTEPAQAPAPRPAQVTHPRPVEIPEAKPVQVPQAKPVEIPQPKPAPAPVYHPAPVFHPAPAAIPAAPKPAPVPAPAPAPAPAPKIQPIKPPAAPSVPAALQSEPSKEEKKKKKE